MNYLTDPNPSPDPNPNNKESVGSIGVGSADDGEDVDAVKGLSAEGSKMQSETKQSRAIVDDSHSNNDIEANNDASMYFEASTNAEQGNNGIRHLVDEVKSYTDNPEGKGCASIHTSLENDVKKDNEDRDGDVGDIGTVETETTETALGIEGKGMKYKRTEELFNNNTLTTTANTDSNTNFGNPSSQVGQKHYKTTKKAFQRQDSFLEHQRRQSGNGWGLVDHEMETNKLLRTLIIDPDYIQLLEFLHKYKGVLLLPPEVISNQHSIDKYYIQRHIIIRNPHNPEQFVSFNGACGLYENRKIGIRLISDELSHDKLTIFHNNITEIFEKLDSFFVENKKIFQGSNAAASSDNVLVDNKAVSDDGNGSESSTQKESKMGIYVLREGIQCIPPHNPELDFLITFISEPVSVKTAKTKVSAGKHSQNQKNFKQKLSCQSCMHIVKEINSFVNNILASSNTIPYQKLIEQFRNFVTKIETRFKLHPNLWNSDEEIGRDIEAFEKYLSIKLYSKMAYPVGSDDRKLDAELSLRIDGLRFIKTQHLDIKDKLGSDVDTSVEELKNRVGTEFSNMNNYKAPRDKLVCLVNGCKIILSHLTNRDRDKNVSADDLLPVLIYIILRSNPLHLLPNMLFIQRYRMSSKMMVGETGYYHTVVKSAVDFIKKLDATCLSIDNEEFDKNLIEAELRLGAHLTPIVDDEVGSSLAADNVDNNKKPEREFLSKAGELIGKVKNILNSSDSEESDDDNDHTIMNDKIQEMDKKVKYYKHLVASQQRELNQLRRIGRGGQQGVADANKEIQNALQTYKYPIQRFRQLNVEGLVMTDIPVLLDDYQRLANVSTQHIALLEMAHNALIDKC